MNMEAERVLVVDNERAFLHSALVDGEPYDTMELLDLTLDRQIDPAIYTPEVPPGIPVHEGRGLWNAIGNFSGHCVGWVSTDTRRRRRSMRV